MGRPTAYDYFNYISLLFEHFLSVLGVIIKQFLIYSLALLVIIIMGVSIFEYGEGWNDLSRLEILFLVLTVLLVKRWFKRGQEAGHTKSVLLHRLVKSIAFYGAVLAATWLFVDLYEESSNASMFFEYSVVSDIAFMGGFLFVFLLGAPLPPVPKIFSSQPSVADTVSVEDSVILEELQTEAEPVAPNKQ